MSGVIPFDQLFPLTTMPELAMRVFAWNPSLNKNEGVTLSQVATLLGIAKPTWADVTGKPTEFAPSAHTLGSHTGVHATVDSSPDGVILSKVAGAWRAVVLDYLKPGEVPNVESWVLGITESEIENWNLAYSRGDHAGRYRPISYVPTWADVTGKPGTFAPDAHALGSHSDTAIGTKALGQLLRWSGTKWENWTSNFLTAESDPVFTESPAFEISLGNIAQWNQMISFLADVDDYTVPYAESGALKGGKLKVVMTENPDPLDEEFIAVIDHYQFETPVQVMQATEAAHPVRLDQLNGPVAKYVRTQTGSYSPDLTGTTPQSLFENSFSWLASYYSIGMVIEIELVGSINRDGYESFLNLRIGNTNYTDIPLMGAGSPDNIFKIKYTITLSNSNEIKISAALNDMGGLQMVYFESAMIDMNSNKNIDIRARFTGARELNTIKTNMITVTVF